MHVYVKKGLHQFHAVLKTETMRNGFYTGKIKLRVWSCSKKCYQASQKILNILIAITLLLNI